MKSWFDLGMDIFAITFLALATGSSVVIAVDEDGDVVLGLART